MTADYAGSSKERQEVGLPGHCEACARVGHVRAHPDLGCGDVGCTRAHSEPRAPAARTIHTDPEHRRLAAAFDAHLATVPEVENYLDGAQHYELAATLANIARRLGWTPPSKT